MLRSHPALLATVLLAYYLSYAHTQQPDDALLSIDQSVASELRGGACIKLYSRNCGGGVCGTQQGFCGGSGLKRTPLGSACNSNCSIWHGWKYCGG